uniref:C-type lectin domain-containing protein n=1 Tax=Amphilophus citrinellus TaxID=61819 RepID=A0A3Q0RI28_AMPCI
MVTYTVCYHFNFKINLFVQQNYQILVKSTHKSITPTCRPGFKHTHTHLITGTCRRGKQINKHYPHQYNQGLKITETCGRCPSGWILLKTLCYYFSHQEINSRKNWTESREHCVSQGGDLLDCVAADFKLAT